MRKNIARTLSQLTGGEYERFATRNAFEDSLLNFANHLHARYELSFEPKNPHAGLHHIRVRLRVPDQGQTLLYRRTYLIPSGKEER